MSPRDALAAPGLGPELPGYLQVEPVGQCNLRCQMCAIQFRSDGPPEGPPAFMDYELFTRLIDDFSDLQHLHLQGLGEPMMHPRFFDMIGYAASRGVRVTTNSNMTLVTEARAGRLVDSGLHTLHASIDGSTAETFEAIRRRAHFDRVLEGVRRVADVRADRSAALPRIHIVAVLMRRNLAELPDLVRLAHELSADELFVQHLAHDFAESSLPERYAPMRAWVDEQMLLGRDGDRGEVERVFERARREATRLGLRLRLPRTEVREHPPGTPGRQRCDWPWSSAYVAYDGSAMPCCMVGTPDRAHMGGVGRDGIAGVWSGEAYRSFRAALDSDRPPDVCAGCAIYRGIF